MFSVIFEVKPRAERFDDYLAFAAQLKPLLQTIDGFVDNERFESRRRPGWLLSHSTWRDEKSVVRWRSTGAHHRVQQRGRDEVFADYHLRVGDVVFDTAPPPDAPVREQRFDETETGVAKSVTLTELDAGSDALLAANPDELPARLGLAWPRPDAIEHDVFASIATPGKLALLVAWRSAAAAAAWTPAAIAGLAPPRHRRVRIVRDYGMFDRREAPQYHAAVDRDRGPERDGRAS